MEDMEDSNPNPIRVSKTQSVVISKLTQEFTKASTNLSKALHYASKPFSDGEDELQDSPLTPAERKKQAEAVHGSLANVLPLSDENKLDVETSGADAKQTGGKEQPQGFSRLAQRSNSTHSAASTFQGVGGVGVGGDGERKGPLLTPGEIRLRVLEWLYEERDDSCEELCMRNLTILTDLIPPFVSVVLHGKSEPIRSAVWAYLLEGCSTSPHFAFLVICSLNANKQVEEPEEDGRHLGHKEDANDIDKVVTEKMAKIRDEFKVLSANIMSEQQVALIQSISEQIEGTIKDLEVVHHKHVLRHIDQGPTSRENVDFLIQRVRLFARSIKDNKLDGKIGFIKTLTDLDEWLLRLPREERLAALKAKLRGLSHSLPFGAYFPVHAVEEHKVLKILVDETIVFNTAHKCPFLLVAEIETVGPTSSWQDYYETQEFDEDLNQSEASVSTYKQGIELVASHSNASINDELQSADHGGGQDVLIDHDSNKSEDDQLLQSCQKPVDVEADIPQTESWEEMVERIRAKSEYGHRPNWRLAAMFVKASDDLRQQQLGVLVVSTFQKIFWEEKVPVWIAPYRVIATGPSSGLLEPARNADSIARIKEREGLSGIDEYFDLKFGPRDTTAYKVAQRNFMVSLAGYSVVAYIIKLHDRHNGNILVDTDGHLLHIDFGFMLGYSHKLERSPFKLTRDMVAVLGGPRSNVFQKFRRLMEKAFIAANKHHREIELLVELMGVGSSSPCFAGGRRWVIDELRERFKPGLSRRKLKKFTNDIIDKSLGNMTSRCYDSYQRCVNGIF